MAQSERLTKQHKDEAEDDFYLIDEIAAGNTEAMRDFDARYRHRMVPWLSRFFRGMPDTDRAALAEETWQDVLLKVARGAPTFAAQSTVFTWMYRIAHNAAIDTRRREEHRLASQLELRTMADADDFAREAMMAGELTVPSRAEVAEVERAEAAAERTRSALAVYSRVESRLTPVQREVLFLHEVQGLKYREVADALGVPIGTVMSRLHTARMRVAGILADEAIAARAGILPPQPAPEAGPAPAPRTTTTGARVVIRGRR
jgi:RNA polymerase sigma-70 factor, ECF subfamily